MSRLDYCVYYFFCLQDDFDYIDRIMRDSFHQICTLHMSYAIIPWSIFCISNGKPECNRDVSIVPCAIILRQTPGTVLCSHAYALVLYNKHFSTQNIFSLFCGSRKYKCFTFMTFWCDEFTLIVLDVLKRDMYLTVHKYNGVKNPYYNYYLYWNPQYWGKYKIHLDSR